MDSFRRSLEKGLHRPVLDETGLTGSYGFQIQGEAQTTEEFSTNSDCSSRPRAAASK
jgi:uncharacterized protein (TIGR03435 family)